MSIASHLVTLANSTAEGVFGKSERAKTPCREHSFILQESNDCFCKALKKHNKRKENAT